MLCIYLNREKEVAICDAFPDLLIEASDYQQFLDKIKMLPLEVLGKQYKDGVIIGVIDQGTSVPKNVLEDIVTDFNRKELSYGHTIT